MHARVQCSCQLHIMFHRPNIFEHNTDCVILFFFWCFVCYNNSLLSLVPSLASQGVPCETSLVSTIDNREEYFSLSLAGQTLTPRKRVWPARLLFSIIYVSTDSRPSAPRGGSGDETTHSDEPHLPEHED